MFARRLDHILLGAAGVGHYRMRRQRRRDTRENAGHLSDRRPDQHQIGAGNGMRNIGLGLVDHAQTQRILQILAAAADTDHLPDHTRLFQRQRKRTADQADANDH